MTLKAARIIAAAPVVALFRQARARSATRAASRRRRSARPPRNCGSNIRSPPRSPLDDLALCGARSAAFYERAPTRWPRGSTRGHDVALLCEGDPFFYGSSMYLFDRLSQTLSERGRPGRHRHERLLGARAAADDAWRRHADGAARHAGRGRRSPTRLAGCDAAVIMKVGRNLPRSGRAASAPGLADARDLCRARHDGGRAHHAARRTSATRAVPYFALVLVPGRQAARR